MRDDLESYRGALAWLIEHHRPDEAIGIAGGLMFFWIIRGHAAEGRRWYERILNNHAFVFALGPLAVAAMRKGDETWPARILGARDAVSERTRATFAVRQSLDNLIGLAEREVRARLGPDRWAAAYAAGRQTSIDSLLKDIDRVG